MRQDLLSMGLVAMVIMSCFWFMVTILDRVLDTGPI